MISAKGSVDLLMESVVVSTSVLVAVVVFLQGTLWLAGVSFRIDYLLLGMSATQVSLVLLGVNSLLIRGFLVGVIQYAVAPFLILREDVIRLGHYTGTMVVDTAFGRVGVTALHTRFHELLDSIRSGESKLRRQYLVNRKIRSILESVLDNLEEDHVLVIGKKGVVYQSKHAMTVLTEFLGEGKPVTLRNLYFANKARSEKSDMGTVIRSGSRYFVLRFFSVDKEIVTVAVRDVTEFVVSKKRMEYYLRVVARSSKTLARSSRQIIEHLCHD